MPATTPTGITYPCSGDTIDPDVFATYATTTQDALNSVQAQVDQALRPPAVSVRTDSPGQTIAAGVTTTMAYQMIMYDTAAMFSASAPTVITVPEDGTYLAHAWFSRSSPPTTELAYRVAILVGGVERAFQKLDGGGSGSFTAVQPFFVSALLPSLTAGNQITSTSLLVGTGSAVVRTALMVTKVSSF